MHDAQLRAAKNAVRDVKKVAADKAAKLVATADKKASAAAATVFTAGQ